MKTTIRSAVLLVAGFVLSGCASTTSAPSDRVEASPAVAAQLTETEKDAMSSEEKVALYNEGQAEEDRVYCRKMVITGSHKKKTVCRTLSEIKSESRSAQDAIRRTSGGLATDPGGVQ